MLSPDGSYVLTMPQQSSRIYSTDNQTDVTPDSHKYQVVLLTQWLDDETYTAIASEDGNLYRGPVAELFCSALDGACTTGRDSVGSFDSLVFPVGGSLTDR